MVLCAETFAKDRKPVATHCGAEEEPPEASEEEEVEEVEEEEPKLSDCPAVLGALARGINIRLRFVALWEIFPQKPRKISPGAAKCSDGRVNSGKSPERDAPEAATTDKPGGPNCYKK